MLVRICCFILFAGLLVALSACTGGEQSQPADPEMIQTATIKDIMDSIVDPSAEFLFEAVATIADENGIREIAPETDEEWAEVRRRAVALLEAPNLMVMEGRRVAQAGEKAENPQIELAPEEIQKLVDANRPQFITLARGLQEAAMSAVSAADAKDKDALFHAAEIIDIACENCHIEYWYPNDPLAVEALRQKQQVQEQK
jgi:hypothetical protein